MNPAVVLCNPPNASPPKSILPLSLLAVGAMLEGHHEWTLVDGNVERNPVDLALDMLERTGAPVLGVTVMPGPQLRGAMAVSHAAGSWRWWTRQYDYPTELRALQRVFAYQRPETTGF